MDTNTEIQLIQLSHEVCFRNQEQLNKVVSDILSSDTLTDLLKQCESGNDDEQSGNALLAMLQVCPYRFVLCSYRFDPTDLFL